MATPQDTHTEDKEALKNQLTIAISSIDATLLRGSIHTHRAKFASFLAKGASNLSLFVRMHDKANEEAAGDEYLLAQGLFVQTPPAEDVVTTEDRPHHADGAKAVIWNIMPPADFKNKPVQMLISFVGYANRHFMRREGTEEEEFEEESLQKLFDKLVAGPEVKYYGYCYMIAKAADEDRFFVVFVSK